MALDTVTVSALAEELSARLTDGRIEKIQQPEKDLLLLTIRAEGENRKLLIRAAGPNARVHLTEQSFENPKEAPMFCMLLRKYLTGARIRSVEQPNGDRLIAFRLESRNELGDSAELSLITELMGRAANVVLVGADGRIVDCLRRIPLSEHGTRALLPGLRYELPPIPEGFEQKNPAGDEKKARALKTPNTECRSISELLKTPNTERRSISELLDSRYGAMERQELQRRRAQELVKSVRRARDRQQRKLAAQAEELRRTERLEDTRRQAELLQANLYRVRRGDRVLECENYYEEDLPLVTIPLDPTRTPQENLNARFREYRKLKGAKEHLTQLITDGEKQLEYLNSVLDELSRAGSTIGRNNLQNDELTTRQARRTDYWFHVQQLHGSHVILCCEGLEPSPESIRAAAELAAYYSQARDSGRTAVDYTMVLNVKKPSGSLPGKVIYRNYRTVIVDAAAAAGEGANP